MSWTRFGDEFADSPEVLGLSDAAFRTHVTAMLWCNRHLTNGAVPARAVRLFTGGDASAIIVELLTTGLWSEDGDRYLIDWSDQESADTVRARRAANAERQQRFRERKSEREQKHAAGDHSSCNYCSSVRRNGVTNESRGASVTPSPSPSRPLGRDGEERVASDVATPSARASGLSTSDATRDTAESRAQPVDADDEHGNWATRRLRWKSDDAQRLLDAARIKADDPDPAISPPDEIDSEEHLADYIEWMRDSARAELERRGDICRDVLEMLADRSIVELNPAITIYDCLPAESGQPRVHIIAPRLTSTVATSHLEGASS